MRTGDRRNDPAMFAELARRVRVHVVRMTNLGKSSHVGSAFSIADILAVLYGNVLHVDPEHPDWPERDRFLLSKGHGGSAIYATLAECGFFPTERLKTHYQNGSTLSGHVSHKGVPGVELSTGSLGHGLGVGAGMAVAARLDGRTNRVFVLMSDGECDEGSTWEAILYAGHHKLSNLVAIVDYNKIQSIGRTDEVLTLEPFADKLRAFNWAVRDVDGHDHAALAACLGGVPFEADRPSFLIAHTVKGKGVSFMEDTVLWHYRSPQGEEFESALKELGEG